MKFVDKIRLAKRYKNIGAIFRGCLQTQLGFFYIVLSKCQMKTFELMEGSIAFIKNHHTFKAYVNFLGLVKGLKEENKMLEAYCRIDMLLQECFPIGAVLIQLR